MAEYLVKGIRVGKRLRPLSESNVALIMKSLEETGELIHPIMVTMGDHIPYLVAGHHRLEAFKRLGKEMISCTEVKGDADACKLLEIDENLAREDISASLRALLTTERKPLYEKAHPETTMGATGRGGKGRRSGDLKSPAERFTADTAKKTKRSERSVQKDVTRGKRIGAEGLKKTIGTALDKPEQLDALATLAVKSPDRAEALIDRAAAGEKVDARAEVKKAKREEKLEALAGRQSVPLPEGRKYGVILADPPWKFEPYSEESGMDRAADNHYPTAALEAICDHLDQEHVADDAVLFLWRTAPMMPQALAVMKAWGFTYKSEIIWVKPSIGTGYWARNRHEVLMIGTRGKIPAPAPGTQPESVIEAAKGRHSEKPEIFYEVIERLFGALPKLEMYARNARPGWDAWGLEAPALEVA